MTRRPRFTQADVTRAIKAVVDIGLTPTRIEIDREGTIALFFDESADLDDDVSKYIGRAKKRR